jgi:hypothetical protein
MVFPFFMVPPRVCFNPGHGLPLNSTLACFYLEIPGNPFETRRTGQEWLLSTKKAFKLLSVSAGPYPIQTDEVNPESAQKVAKNSRVRSGCKQKIPPITFARLHGFGFTGNY